MVWSALEWSGLMARMIQRSEQCVGKTIARTYQVSDMIGFLFEDGTFFLAETDGDGVEAWIDTRSAGITPEIALDLGLLSPEEYQVKQVDRLRLREARDRERYEELRKKYGKSEGSGE